MIVAVGAVSKGASERGRMLERRGMMRLERIKFGLVVVFVLGMRRIQGIKEVVDGRAGENWHGLLWIYGDSNRGMFRIKRDRK